MPQLDTEDILHRFTHHPPSGARVDEHVNIRGAYVKFALDVIPVLPDGREKSLAATALEESSFWAQAAIARQRG